MVKYPEYLINILGRVRELLYVSVVKIIKIAIYYKINK